MSSLAQVLEWKFPNTEGISTGENVATGKMKIFDWPLTLGPEPTQAQIIQWTLEFDSLPTPLTLAEEVVAAKTLDDLKAIMLKMAKRLQ